MPACPNCQRELDDDARTTGRCPACGVTLRALPQRTIADVRDVGVELPQSGGAGGSHSLESTQGPQPGDQTVDLSASDKTVEFTLSASGFDLNDPSALRTLELNEDKPSAPGAPSASEVPGSATVDFSAEKTIDFGVGPAAGTDADFTLLTSQWDPGQGGASDPNATLKQKETLSGSFITSSSLIVKSRNVRQSSTGVAPAVGSPADAPDYELLNIIGEGGMGVVYAARQSSIARTVALKMLKGDDSSPAQREKFISEAVVTGELDHPNIVPIYDLGANDQGALFYSMKRVKGTPWNKVLKKKSLDENLEILLRTADAVAFAHVNGVVHRDLKPENTMLGDFGEVLVMDWGLARVSNEFPNAASVSQSDAMGGTPAYMAPEMATGPVERITPASDIYLLGAMLFEIVTGKPPHTGDTVMACLFNAAKNRITAVDPALAAEHQELLAVASQAMATEPADRYASVQHFQTAVRQYQAHSESIKLAGHAQKNLAQAAQAQDYDLYARAVYGLEESLGLWPGNVRAGEVLERARIDYARLALGKGDYDLGASLLDPAVEAHQPVLAELKQGQRERESRKRRIKLLKGAVAALVASVVGIVTVAYFSVSRQRDRAVKAEGEAVANYNAAEVARQDAVEQKDRAVKAEGEAVSNFNAAEVARKEAVTQRDRATSEYERAERERKEADAQRQLAVEAKTAEEYAAYVARIGLAKTKIDENAFDRAAELLDQCRRELRHWEWGRLRQLCELASRSWKTAAPVDMAAFAPDGARFAAGGWDGNVTVYDRATGEPVWAKPQGQYVHAVAYDAAGKRIAAGSSDGEVAIYDAAEGTLIKKLAGHDDAVLSVRFSPDGSQLLSSGYDNTARLWDLDAGATRQVFRGHSWWVWAAEFSPDGTRIVTAGQDGKAIVWRLNPELVNSEPYARATEFTHHRRPIYAARFSPDGTQVATAGEDGRVLVWNPDQVEPVDIARRLDNLPDPNEPFVELAGHRGPVRTLAFAPNGTQLASGGQDNVVILWDLAARKAVKQLRGHASHVRSVSFSPDGEWLLSAGRDGQLKLWQPARYAEVEQLATDDGVEEPDAVLAARWSPDGKRIVTASRARTASLWDPSKLARVRWFQEGHEFLATSAVFFADGARLATGAGDGTARIWDVATGGQTALLLDTGRTAALHAAEDGSLVATGGPNGLVKIWNPTSGQLVASLPGHNAEVTAVRLSRDATTLASGDDNGDIRLWTRNADSGEWEAAHELTAHSRTITALAFADDGRKLISASGDNSCGQWNVATGEEYTDLVLKHPDWVADMAVSRDGKLALTACDDGQLRVWSLDDARELRTLETPDDSVAFTSIDVSPDGKLASASRAADGTIWLWNVTTGESIANSGEPGGLPPRSERSDQPWLNLGAHSGLVWSARFASRGDNLLTVGGNDARLLDLATKKLAVRFSPHGAVASADVSPDGKRVVTGSWDKTAKVWDAGAGKVLFKLDGLHDGAVNSVCFSPDGQRILTASDDATARLWNAADGAPLEPVLRGHTGRLREAVFSPDGSRILTVSADKTARIIDATTGETLHTLAGHEWGLFAGAFSADGRLVVTGSEDNTAIVWDAMTGEQIQKLAGHTAAVTAVALSPDGARALTGSQDNAVKLWDAQTGKEILTLAGHDEEVTSASFSPNGLSALTSGRDGKVLIWPAVDWKTPAEQARR